MYIDFILNRCKEFSDETALISKGKKYKYHEVIKEYEYWNKRLVCNGVKNRIVSVQGEFNISTIGLMLAIIENENIYVPIAKTVKNINRYYEVSRTQVVVDVKSKDIKFLSNKIDHDLLREIVARRKNPGLILFSSGTTGEPKAAIHDLVPMLKKYMNKGKKINSIAFLLFDHIGGFNTVMYNISNGGKMVTLEKRSPEEVCKAIQDYKVEVLPTSPSFLNMIIYSGIYKQYDLTSLRLITYGTEPMPKSTLVAFNKLFPQIRLKQTYGLSELGIMRTKSESSNSLWLKLGDDEHKIDIRDNILWIKTDMAMLGYLNAKSPFDDNGWFNTKDKVEVKGDYIKILGRESELINVGGEKVYPAEVESVLLEIEGIKDAIVKGEDNSLLGKIVVCDVIIDEKASIDEVRKSIKRHSKEKLEKFKRPVRINFVEKSFVTNRFKRKR